MSIGHFAFANNSNRFLAVPELLSQPFAIAGVPFDGAVTNRPGARFGPQEIRRASLMLCDGLHPYFEVTPLGLLGDIFRQASSDPSVLTTIGAGSVTSLFSSMRWSPHQSLTITTG